MDVSADLTELGRTPIAVVCAGAKSLLDIGRTLEFLVQFPSLSLSLSLCVCVCVCARARLCCVDNWV